MKEIRTQVYLPRELHGDLKRQAAERGTSMAQIVREAVERTLYAYSSAPERENFVAEAPARYDAGEGRGPSLTLHLDTDELRRLDEAARSVGQDREAWMRDLVRRELDAVARRSRYRSDPAWSLPELVTAFPGIGDADAAERHDELLYGPLAGDPA